MKALSAAVVLGIILNTSVARAEFSSHAQEEFSEACATDFQRRMAPKMGRHSKAYIKGYGKLACDCLKIGLSAPGPITTEQDWLLFAEMLKKGSWNTEHLQGSTPKVTEALPMMAGMLYAGLGVEPGKSCMEAGIQKLPAEYSSHVSDSAR